MVVEPEISLLGFEKPRKEVTSRSKRPENRELRASILQKEVTISDKREFVEELLTVGRPGKEALEMEKLGKKAPTNREPKKRRLNLPINLLLLWLW